MQPTDVWFPAYPSKSDLGSAKAPLRPALLGTADLHCARVGKVSLAQMNFLTVGAHSLWRERTHRRRSSPAQQVRQDRRRSLEPAELILGQPAGG